MKLRTLTLTGFQSYRETETIDFTGVQRAAIIGANHSGKSTIVDGIKTALYGAVRTEKMAECITTGATQADLELIFDLGDGTYRIARTIRTKKGQEASLWVSDPDAPDGWRPLSEKNVRQTDDAIVGLIGMPAGTSASSWLIEQSDVGRFCDATPAVRRDILASAFNLDAYATLAAAADERARTAQTELDRATWALQNLETTLTDLTEDGPLSLVTDDALTTEVEECERRAADATTRLATLTVRALTDAADQADQALAQHTARAAAARDSFNRQTQLADQSVAETQRRVTAAQNAHVRASTALWGINAAEDEAARADTTHTEATCSAQTARDTLASYETQAATLAAERDALAERGAEGQKRSVLLGETIAAGTAACFTCQQSLTGEHAHTLKADQDAAVAALRQQWKDTGARYTTCINDRQRAAADLAAATTKAANAANARDAAHRNLAELRSVANGLTAAQTELDAATAAADAATTARNSLTPPDTDDDTTRALTRAAQDAHAARDSENSHAAQERSTCQESLTQARTRLRELWAEQNNRATTTAKRAALQAPLTQAQDDVAAHTHTVAVHQLLKEAFSPKGIPAMILAGVVEELNDDANAILAELGTDGLGVDVRTVKDTGTGARDEVTVYALTADGTRNYRSLSGSEKARIALAIRCAMIQCVARRTGTPIETIIQDEGFGQMDDETRRATLAVLEKLAERFTVLVVSHIEDVSAAFPTTIQVSMATGTSRVTTQTT